MPYITVESGTLSDKQKELLIKRLTEVSSEIMNVLIHDKTLCKLVLGSDDYFFVVFILCLDCYLLRTNYFNAAIRKTKADKTF